MTRAAEVGGAGRRAGASDVRGAGQVAGLILAAGGGTRFGTESKLLADLDGRPLLQWAIDAQCAVAALDRVVVVLGAHAAQLLQRVRFGRADTVVCPDWASGQAASLRCGLAAVSGAAKVIVTLGDAPLVTSVAIARFAGEPPGTRATYRGRPGHPVVLGPGEIETLMSLSGDRGARDLLRGGPVIEVGHLCSGRDVDTRGDLEEIRDEARAID